jgi:5'-nucleotidase, C-terminal domain
MRACGPIQTSMLWSRTPRVALRRLPIASSVTRAVTATTRPVDRLAVDAQRAFAGADVAFLHPGNTRADLKRGPITYAEAFEVQAYEHPLWRFRMSGAQLRDALARQSGLLVSGSRAFEPDLVYTVVANGIVAEREPFARGRDRELVGTDLEALVAWLQRGEV